MRINAFVGTLLAAIAATPLYCTIQTQTYATRLQRSDGTLILDPLLAPKAFDGDRLDKTGKSDIEASPLSIESNTIMLLFRDHTDRETIENVRTKYGLIIRSERLDILLLVARTSEDEVKEGDYAEATRLHDLAESIARNEPSVECATLSPVLGPTIIPHPNSPKRRDWFAKNPADPLAISGFPEAWNFNDAIIRRHTRIKVGVIDQGFLDPKDKAPDLKITRVGAGHGIHEHGTIVAGIIGATFDNRRIVDGASPFVDVYGCAGEPPVSPNPHPPMPEFQRIGLTVRGFIDCLETLLNVPVRVVNASVGYNWGLYHGIVPENQGDDRSRRAREMTQCHGMMVRRILATKAGQSVTVVSAAGNDGPHDAKWTSPFNWAGLDHSAMGPSDNVIVVEALDKTGTKLLPDSNVGGTIKAIGVNIPSITVDKSNYEQPTSCRTGTSCAAPLVTAAIAHMLAVNPKLDPAAITKKLGIGSSPGPLKAFAAIWVSEPAANRNADLSNYLVDPSNPDFDINMADFKIFKNDFKAFQSGLKTGVFTIDLNGDGEVNPGDARFDRSDFDGDGDIDEDDLEILISAWTDPSIDPNTLRAELKKP